jgi:hypothetical protein
MYFEFHILHPQCIKSDPTYLQIPKVVTNIVPNLSEILQGYINDCVCQKDIPDKIKKDHDITIGYLKTPINSLTLTI